MSLKSWIPLEMPVQAEEKEEFERLVTDRLDLAQAVEDNELKSFRYVWDKEYLKTIRLTPSHKTRNTPGLKQLRKLFF